MVRNKHFLCILLAGSLLCLSACGRQTAFPEAPSAADDSSGSPLSDAENSFTEDVESAAGGPFSDTENLFAEDAKSTAGGPLSDTENLFAEDAEAENIPRGSIVHWADSRAFTYNGEVLEIPYHIEGSGLGANCGFLLFLDGIPQPYRIESEGSCSWLHRLNLTDNVQKDFSFYLEPVTGKAGETLTLTILSLNPQSFEGTKELPLGASQNFLENYVSLAFEADAPAETGAIPAETGARTEPDSSPAEPGVIRAEPDAALAQPAEGSNAAILRSLSASEEELTPESMDSYLSDGTGTPTASVSELSTHVFQSCSLSEDGTEFSHILLGHPGVRYRTTLFLDYSPLWYEGSCYVDRDLKSGLASRLDAKLNPGALDGAHILSVLSVPRNASDFPDDVLITETWSAIFGDAQ